MLVSLASAREDPGGEGIAQQLSQGYHQLRAIQENNLAAVQRQHCQAYGTQLADLEAQVWDRERSLLLSKRHALGELGTLKGLVSLEKRQGASLQRRVQDQSRVWPCLAEQQAQIEAYHNLAAIYREEFHTASELVDALRSESQTWERRVFDESAMAEAWERERAGPGVTPLRDEVRLT